MENGIDLRKKKQLSHMQFTKAVDCLRKNKETFLSQRPTAVETAIKLQELCGFSVTRGAVADLKEASGIHWQASKREFFPDERRFHARNSTVTVARAVLTLYRKLNEEPPDGLLALVEQLK